MIATWAWCGCADGVEQLELVAEAADLAPGGEASGDPCGSIALCHFSAPARDWRHWKKSTPSAPRATAW